jgi:hypothetical protein
MDTLKIEGGWGGAALLTSGYEHNPLVVSQAAQHLSVVSDLASLGVAVAITYDRWRLSLDFDSLVAGLGHSGSVDGYQFAAPSVDLSSHPDNLTDVRVGFDARLFGEAGGAFRLGAGAQLYIPSGAQSDYDSDGTFRGMLRVLAAGDVGMFTYAAQLGVHIRPINEVPIPDAPRRSELLFGVGPPQMAIVGSQGLKGCMGYSVTALARSFRRTRIHPKMRIPVWVKLAAFGGSGTAFFSTLVRRRQPWALASLRATLAASAALYGLTALLDFLEHLRLETEIARHPFRAKAIPASESALHGVLLAVNGSVLLLGRPLRRIGRMSAAWLAVAPFAFLILGSIDELAFHRRRVLHREHIIHTMEHLAEGVMWTTVYGGRLACVAPPLSRWVHPARRSRRRLAISGRIRPRPRRNRAPAAARRGRRRWLVPRSYGPPRRCGSTPPP